MQSSLCVLVALGAGLASGTHSAGSAVTRVVKLLKDLEAKLEREEETEQDLYDKFVCWGTSTVDAKTKATDEANARIGFLEKYVTDVSSGKITFTMNRDELSKELDSVNKSLDNDTASEKARHAAAETNEKDTAEAIDGLQDVVKTLNAAQNAPTSAPSGKVNAGLVQLRGAVQSGTRLGARARMQKAKQLQTALELGDQYLSKANSLFLRHMLTGQANDVHVKEHKATKSSKVVHVTAQERLIDVIRTLKGVTDNFQKQLRAAERSDVKAFEAYKKRHEMQEAQQEALKSSLAKLEKEYAARNKAKLEAEAEAKSLKEQIAADADIMKETKSALEKRKKEWDARLKYRQGEQEALGKAIELLTSDDARDLFDRSASFLQLSSGVAMGRVRAASSILRSAGSAAQNQRLKILAAQLSLHMRSTGIKNPTFDGVYEHIDSMAKAINAEEAKDFKTKEDCEEDLDKNTAKRKQFEREIEDESSSISFANGKITEMESRLKKLSAEEAEIDEQLKSASDLRASEAAEFATSKKDDEDAILLIDRATEFLVNFYKTEEDAGTTGTKTADLVQTDSELRQAPETWKESTYSGAGSQSSGIIQTMKMVAEDVRKEVLEAKKDEDESIAEYNKVKAKLEAEKAEIKADRAQFTKTKSDASGDLKDASASKQSFTGLLENLVGTMADVKPNCDFYLKNFEARSANRASELAGLNQAKAVLEGSQI
eukprot:TRINITY_DN1604_c0_g6_i1.p1 TRINITY_DN1604_c0_g6~~TRINITY_DN1604_c0_g6_i1.p1  ORF type:complete len:717 (-),score=214.69 TRINITY_DN1604_c0_g6_i1:165-2315(-)